MLKSRVIACSVLITLVSCANYEASMLLPLAVQEAVQANKHPEILVSCKVFGIEDSLNYLGRDVISEGYIPIHMTIRNNSNDPMYLNPGNFSIPLAPVNEVANKVHTSTAGRVAGWGIPGLFIWPFLVPAIYDGIKSREANAALDADYLAKAIKEQTIQPHSHFNGIVFVPKQNTSQVMELFLVNERTSEKIACPLFETIRR